MRTLNLVRNTMLSIVLVIVVALRLMLSAMLVKQEALELRSLATNGTQEPSLSVLSSLSVLAEFEALADVDIVVGRQVVHLVEVLQTDAV